ncbi:hypothetical protein [Caenimonas koreensis]|uniref:hypothetical protein n=1 Tax=Caenimonas koreensis TaxID=367474 RepID=UPI0037847525
MAISQPGHQRTSITSRPVDGDAIAPVTPTTNRNEPGQLSLQPPQATQTDAPLAAITPSQVPRSPLLELPSVLYEAIVQPLGGKSLYSLAAVSKALTDRLNTSAAQNSIRQTRERIADCTQRLQELEARLDYCNGVIMGTQGHEYANDLEYFDDRIREADSLPSKIEQVKQELAALSG